MPADEAGTMSFVEFNSAIGIISDIEI